MEQIVGTVLSELDKTRTFTTAQLVTVKSTLQRVLDDYDFKLKGNQIVSYDVLQPEAYKAFLVMKKAEGLSERTVAQYKHILDHFFLALMKPLESITTTDIQLYLYKKSSRDHNQTRSVNNHRTILNAFFNWCANTGWLKINPMATVKVFKGQRKAYIPIRDDEFEVVLNNARCQRDRAIMTVMAGSGIRNSELCSAKRSRLDLQNKRFYVMGKGGKERLCFLTPRAKYELEQYLSARTDNEDYIFVTERMPYRKLKPVTIDRMFQRVREVTGIYIYPHKLRHYFADNAHSSGIDVYDISKMLGHESIETTKIYMSVNDDDLAYKHTKLK